MRENAINQIQTEYRIKFRFLLLTFLLVVFYTTLLFSATIYIDPSNTAPNQNGTITNPYRSWTMTTWTSGNIYLQKRGTTYNTSGGMSIFNQNNITFGAYGTGARPRIISSGNDVKVINFRNASNIIIRDLEVGSTGNATVAVIIDGTGAANNLIDNCELHHCEWGVRILSIATGNRILNTIIHDIGDDGIYVKDVNDIEIGYCHVYNVNTKYYINPDQSYSPGDNIQLVSLNDLYFNIHHNTLDHSSTGNKFCFIAAGETYNGLIEYNTMVGNSGAVTTCIYLGNTSGTVTVRYNTLRDGNYAIYSYADNLQLHYNKIARNNQGVSVMATHSLTALNNVFYNNSNNCIGSGSNTSVTSRNNIFHLSGGGSRVYSCNSVIVSNYNDFNTQQTSFLNGHSTLASWQSTTGNDLNSLVANPVFVNPATDDFSLQSTSPCINRGTNVGLTRDFFGTTVPQAGIQDVGMHEYISNQGGTNLAPVINNQTFQINENSANATNVGTVIATDPNAGQILTFSIISGNTNSAFALNSSTGRLTVANSQALNFESISSFPLTVRATDNGTGNLWSQATITVNLSNVNEIPVIASQSFTVVQNAANGTIVGTAVASDPDQGQALSFTITSGNTNNAFAINSTTGRITVASSAAVVSGSFSLTVRATDNGSPVLYASAIVSITVTATSNQAPVMANQSFSIVQNSPIGTLIGDVTATDPNAGQTLTYSITAGNPNNIFTIVTSNGNLLVASSTLLTPGTYSLTVRATDNGSPVLYAQATITINVTTQSNQAPVIANQSFSIVQNSPNGTLIGDVTATDPNAGQTLTYAITAGNTNNIFTIVSGNGNLLVANTTALNPGTFPLTVRVTDNGNPVLYSQATVTITVTSTSNQAPVISSQSFSVTENAPNGTLVGTVIATDPNAGQTLTYAITAGNSSTAFAISPTNGNLTVANYYVLYPRTFLLTVRVTDNGNPGLYSQATITITVTNSTNQAPSIANQSFSIVQYSPNGTLIGTVAASDPNSGQILTYAIISGNSNGVCSINSGNGNLLVANSTSLSPQTLTLIVRATDNGCPVLSSQASITVNVLPPPNQAPIIANQSFTVVANAPNGTLIAHIAASDPNSGQTLTFAITAGNTSNIFAIVASNGNLLVANSTALIPGTYALTVRATDNGSPVLWSQATITITVPQQSNQPPVIANQSFSIDENSPNGSVAGTIIAVDPNQGQTLTYSITGGNTNTAFIMNPNTGALLVNNSMALNYEYIQAFALTVRVTDNGTGYLWAQANIQVNINNLNEAPVLNASAFTIAEFASNGTFVGAVSGADPDLGQSVSYQIISGNTSGAFHLNSSNGALNVTNSTALNVNVNPVFYLTVKIQDNGQPSLFSTGLITVSVLSNKQGELTMNPEPTNDVEKNRFTIFPNPSSDGIFNIKSETYAGASDVQIINSSGKLVNKVYTTSDSILTVDLSDQPDGMYFLKISSENKTYTYKAIKN